MEMKLEVRVSKPHGGHVKGSLPWLLAQQPYLHIAWTTKGNNQAAWLMGRDGSTITILAMRNADIHETDGDPAGPISLIEEHIADEKNMGDVFCAHMPFTAAAWKVVRKIAEQAAELMQTVADEADLVEEDDEVEVVLLRLKDADAKRVLSEGPQALAIFHDRLKEKGVEA